jgi:hypothetical protein
LLILAAGFVVVVPVLVKALGISIASEKHHDTGEHAGVDSQENTDAQHQRWNGHSPSRVIHSHNTGGHLPFP